MSSYFAGQIGSQASNVGGKKENPKKGKPPNYRNQYIRMVFEFLFKIRPRIFWKCFSLKRKTRKTLTSTVGKRYDIMRNRPLRPARQTREAARAEAQEARGACEPRPRSPEHPVQCFYVNVSVRDTN